GLPVRHRQHDQHDADRDEDEDVDDFLDHEVTLSALKPQSSWSVWPGLRRSRSSLPVLKKGTHFSSTKTASPVRGLRPEREGRFLTEKAPKPRSSTRLPAASASVISSKIALTMFSTSRKNRCGLRAAMICTSSDLIMNVVPADGSMQKVDDFI